MRDTRTSITYTGAVELEAALRAAAIAHGRHEEETGEADPDWPTWYANHMWSADGARC